MSSFHLHRSFQLLTDFQRFRIDYLMAEARLGVAAGAVGIAGFALQLANLVQKLKSFHSQLINAPEELRRIIDEIASLSCVLGSLEIQAALAKKSRTPKRLRIASSYARLESREYRRP
jgi:hypothetical protein